MTTSLNKIYNLISEFNELLWNIRKWEGISEYFVVFEGEDVDTYRPNYDYEETQNEIAGIKRYLRYLNTVINKTKANLFNFPRYSFTSSNALLIYFKVNVPISFLLYTR